MGDAYGGMLPFDPKELFIKEIMNYNKFDMQYAIDNNINIVDGVIARINDYQETYHMVKAAIRFYWGKLVYIFDNPEEIIDVVRDNKPELFEVNGAEEYISTQIRKVGYALYDYLQPSERVKVKLNKKAIKYAKKLAEKKGK